MKLRPGTCPLPKSSTMLHLSLKIWAEERMRIPFLCCQSHMDLKNACFELRNSFKDFT